MSHYFCPGTICHSSLLSWESIQMIAFSDINNIEEINIHFSANEQFSNYCKKNAVDCSLELTSFFSLLVRQKGS